VENIQSDKYYQLDIDLPDDNNIADCLFRTSQQYRTKAFSSHFFPVHIGIDHIAGQQYLSFH
jgi:hypothetical protein